MNNIIIGDAKLELRGIIAGIVLLIVLATAFGTYYTIDGRERGVLLTWSKPETGVIEPGLHFKIPWMQDIEKFSIETQKYEANASAASKDLQTVHTRIAVNYHLDPASVVDMYIKYGHSYEGRIIQPVVQEVVKSITARFSAEELITKRETVKTEILNNLSERLINNYIIVEGVSITDFEFSDTFNKAIEDKVTAQQQKQKAETDLQRIRIETDSKIVEAQGQAKALAIQKANVTDELIELRKTEVQAAAVAKWDGHMPSVVGGALPFLDVSTYNK